MMHRFIFSLFCLMACSVVFAQEDFTVQVNKDKIVIGEPFELVLQATVKAGTSPGWSVPDSIRHFEILGTPAPDTLRSGDYLQLRQRLLLTSWDSGQWNIPSIRAGNISSKPIAVMVSFSSFDPKQDYHDIREIIEVKAPKKSTWHWYLLLLSMITGLFFLLFPIKRREKKTNVITSDPGVYKRSMKALETLLQDTEQREPKQFYTDLVNIFRNYLHLRKGIYSPSQTTGELVQLLEAKNLLPQLQDQVKLTLQESDGVKFARYPAGTAEKQAALDHIKQAIVALENKD